VHIHFKFVVPAVLPLLCLQAGAATTEVSLQSYACTSKAAGISLPKKLSSIRALGPRTAEESGDSQQWDGYTSTERTLHFKGMSLQLVTFSNDPERYLLSTATIDSGRWSLSAIRIGQPTNQAFAALGYHGKPIDGSWRFVGESESLYLEARAGKVSKLVFECYTG
jgi:hypothetical protein